MRFETLLRTLLLGVALSVSPASAAELAAPAAPVDGGADTLQPAAAKDVANGQRQRRLKKARIKGSRGGADTEAALKKDGVAGNSSGGAAAVIPESIPPAEPQSVALRGVRG